VKIIQTAFIAIFLITSFQLTAQKSKITGKVVNSKTGNPMGYTNVSLFNEENELITGAVTSAEGTFTLQALPGSYNLRIQFVSYETINKPVQVNEEQVDIGKIAMSEDVDQLSEIVIEARKPQMEMKLDKRVFNVGQDLSNVGGSAENILDNLPSVTVDVDGNVSLRGSQNVRILINGRPSGFVGMDGSSGLNSIPADMIESIEVITNPSARYEAEGNAGIINIVLKKDEKAGINGSFSINTGYPLILGASANLNYRKNRLNFFGSYGVRYDENFGGGFRDQVFFDDSREDSAFLYNDIYRFRQDLSHNFRFGLDYNFNESTILTGSLLYRISEEDNLTENEFINRNSERGLVSRVLRTQNEIESEEVLEYNLNFTKTFNDNDDHKLTADVQYRNNSDVEDSDITTDTLSYEAELLQEVSLIDEFSEDWLLQAAYMKPFNKETSLEIGWRTTLRNIDNSFRVQQQQQDGSFQDLDQFTNDFVFKENIHALYAIFNKEWSQWSFQTGLRVENTDIRTEFRVNSDSLIDREPFTNIFPSVFLTYGINKQTDLQVSYSRRIDRPGFWSLNPFSNFGDNTNIRIGNPNLNPEYTDSYEIGLMNNFDNATLYSGVYYRRTEGVVQRINTVVNGVIFRQPQNLGFRNSVGLEQTYSHDLNQWWQLNGNVNIFYQQVTSGDARDAEGKLINLDAETFTLTSRITSQMTFWDDFTFQLSGFYRAPEREPQRLRRSFYMIDLGLSKDLFKGNGTLSFSVRDLLNSRIWRTTTTTSSTEFNSEFQWRTRTFRLTLDYRLNSKKQRGRSEGGRGDNNDGDI
jgi:outer membrane receptor protein involved in Fe transport